MKHYSAGLAAVAVALALVGCDGSGSSSAPSNPTPLPAPHPKPPAAAPAASGAAATNAPLPLNEFGMPTLTNADDLGCVTCHRIDSRLVGPPWMEVSKKYKGATTYKYSSNGSNDPAAKEYPLVEGLVNKVSKGGHGNWGTMSMPANDPTGQKKEKIETVVKFILGLAK